MSHDKATVHELHADPKFAAEYLKAALEDDEPNTLLIALHHLAQFATVLFTFLTIVGMFANGQARSSAIAEVKSIDTEEQLNEWMMHYYQHPQPALTISAVKFMAKEGTLAKDDAQLPIATFLAQIFLQNPEKVQQWRTQLITGTDDQLKTVVLAFWMSGNQSQLKLVISGNSGSVSEYAEKLIANRVPDLLNDEIANPGFLDMLWGSFFATGDERYVQRIISVLPLVKEKKDIAKMLIGGAAQWSLTSNAKQHKKVMDICISEQKKLPADQAEILAEVIKRAKEKK
jgi:hypothetical protein